MSSIDIHYLMGALVLLVLCSAFFSGSETGMMALNRYRLRHAARKGDKRAIRIMQLLRRPDRLLGVILIGNTFANILASSVATVLAVHYFGELGVVIATLVLTMVVLIFSEAAPKTVAALRPESVAYPASLPLKILLKVLYPLVWFVNGLANSFLRIFGVHVTRQQRESLSIDELRTVVREASGKMSVTHQEMLLRVLDLEQMVVMDVMVPRNEIFGIDLDDEWDTILEQLTTDHHAHLPLYRDDINNVEGVLQVRKVLSRFQRGQLKKDDLLRLADKPYYITEGASLSQQLLNFQDEQKSMGLVVDEYGDVLGLVTLQDVLEEIVGEFAAGVTDFTHIRKQSDGSYLVDGRITIRDLNRVTQWGLPIDGPKTLSGMLIEHLEMIPVPGVAARIHGYPMEVIKVSDNAAQIVRIWPELKK